MSPQLETRVVARIRPLAAALQAEAAGADGITAHLRRTGAIYAMTIWLLLKLAYQFHYF